MKLKLSANEKWLVFILLGIYLLFAIIWHFLTDATWDDDCVTRFYNTQEAFKNPAQFISLWNRPLFVLIFAIPFQLGKHMVLLMAVFSAIGAYYLYKSAKKLELQFAFLVVPLLLFQAFFFNVSKSSLAEPLAAVIISAGLFFYLDKKYLQFAVIGSLLPLARLELSVLLIFWIYILFENRKWKYIFILAVPTILWNFAGTIIDGGAFWLLSALKSSNPDENPYGHTDFWHYFHRYIYVLGPVVFYFFFIGFFQKLIKRKIDVFIMLQFIVAFLLYVLFSWKLNLGKAIGFLRNLMPLAPLAAIIALYGFNSWIKSISKPDESANIEKDDKQSVSIEKTIIIVLSIICTILTYFFFSQQLEMHHKISDFKNYTNLIVISLLTALYVFFIVFCKYLNIKDYFKNTIAFLIIICVMSFTLITEPPDIHNNPERNTMSKVSDIYENSILKEFPTYVNHSYFFWANDIKRNDNFSAITKENLDNAPGGSIIIFENHYNQVQNRGVSIEYIEQNPQIIELFRMLSSDKTFYCTALLKIANTKPSEIIKIYNNLIADYPNLPSLYYNRANFLAKYKKFDLAQVDYNKAIELNPGFYEAYFRRGIMFFSQEKYEKAIEDFKKSIVLNPKYNEAYCNQGVCYAVLNDPPNAVKNLTMAILIKNDFYDAYYYRALVYSNSSRFNEAIKDYTQTINLQPNNVENYVSRAKAYFKIGRNIDGINDIKTAYKLDKTSIPAELMKYCK